MTRLPRLFVTSQLTRGTSQLFPIPALPRTRTLTSSAPSAMLKTHEDAIEMCKVIERDPGEFLQSYVADDVHWTVSGPFKKTHPLAGVYHSREEFKQNTFVPLSGKFDGGLKLRVVDVISQFPSRPGDPVKVCMELEGVATLKKSQNEWRNYYSWVMHFKEEKAVTVRAYLDSAIVNEAMAD